MAAITVTTESLPRIAPPRQGRSAGQIFNFIGIVLIHIGAAVAIWRGPTLKLVGLAVGLYFIRMWAITAVYHRYFSHRTYKTSRVMQLLLAILGTTATQKGPLWWASTHRIHHKHSDTERDVHSPLRRGFWYSHMGWWMGRDHEKTDLAQIPDLAGYPELRWVDRWHVLSPLALIAALAFFGGYDVFLWGYAVSTCLLMHGTFTINSLSHVYGSRRFATTDTSRNNFLLAIITLGEGWHNNHHHYQSSANQGFYWWEVDVSYYILKGMEKLGLVWDVRAAPEHIKRRNLIAEVGERSPLLIKTAPDSTPAPVAVPEPDAG